MSNAERTPEAEDPTLGDPSAWVDRMGLPVVPVGDDAETGAITAAELLRLRDEVLCGQEWPAVLKAAELTRRGHHRELLELDATFGRGIPDHLARASWCVGRRQLGRLRGLRDQRVVRRYLDAIESGNARGWNPIVYGVVLAVFGIPLRQGLVHYATAVLRGLALRSGVGRERSRRLLAAVTAPLPDTARALLEPFPGEGLRPLPPGGR